MHRQQGRDRNEERGGAVAVERDEHGQGRTRQAQSDGILTHQTDQELDEWHKETDVDHEPEVKDGKHHHGGHWRDGRQPVDRERPHLVAEASSRGAAEGGQDERGDHRRSA